VKQYKDYGLTAPLVAPLSNDFADPQLADLGDLGLGIIACDSYSAQIDNPLNKAFVDAYRNLWKGEYPPSQAFGGWQAVNLFLAAVKATNGDTTPAKLVEALSHLTIVTPAGKMTMSPYQAACIPTSDFYILKTERVGDRITWVPVYTYQNLLLNYE